MSHDDAIELATGLGLGLRLVPETVLPLGGGPFGDENTAELLRRAASGDTPSRADAQAALEILSGPPRKQALSLVDFLRGGEFEIEPEAASRG